MALSRDKIALIQVAKARLELDDDTYRDLLKKCGGVSSSRDLGPVGFGRLMDEFHRRGFESDFAREHMGRRGGMATAKQVAVIRSLWSEYTEGEGTDASLGKWLESKFKVSALRFVPKRQVSKILHALRAMVERRRRESSLQEAHT